MKIPFIKGFPRKSPLDSNEMSLDEIGLRNGIDQSSAGHGYLNRYEIELQSIKPEILTLVIISGANPIATANTFSEFYPSAKVHVIDMSPRQSSPLLVSLPNVSIVRETRISNVGNLLRGLTNIDVIIDDGTNKRSHKIRLLQELLFYIRDGGKYVCEDLHAEYLPKYSDIESAGVASLVSDLLDDKAKSADMRKHTKQRTRELADAIDRVTSYRKILFIGKRGNHYLKLRDYEANDILSLRYQTSWGHVAATRPGGTFESTAETWTNRRDLSYRFPKVIAYPAVHCREYRNAVVSPGQVITLGSTVLPDTYRHLEGKTLQNRFVVNSSEDHARIPAHDDSIVPMKGIFFYLDTEYPNVYGHVTTEIISRLWAWDDMKAMHPDMKALVFPRDGDADIPNYERRILNAFGITNDDIVCLNRPTAVERLIGATPMFSNPKFVNPEITSIWSRIRDSLIRPSDGDHERIFLTRARGLARDCRNGSEVEKLFRQFGFQIVRPEEYSLGHQVRMISDASVIAGYGGSALLNGVFASKPKTVIVISPDSYNTANEYLISSIHGDQFNYFWCKSDVKHEPGRWTWKAFMSPFEFDFEKDGDSLKLMLESLPERRR